ncbi:hypothetical protein JCM6882_007861 [Rhodosporidiobolus microsporus]
MSTDKGSIAPPAEVRNKYTILTIAFAGLGSMLYGWFSVIISPVLAMPSFISHMGLDTAPNARQLEGAISGLSQGGGLIGCFMSGYTSDRFGRRGAIFIACLLGVLSGALQAGAVNIGMFMAARFIAGLSVGNIQALVPTLMSEFAPPHSRGFLVGLHGVFILLGCIMADWLGAAFFHVQNEGAQWRVPLALQALWPLLLASGIWFIPESPRWLLQKGRTVEALEVCKKLRAHSSDPDSTFAHSEFALMSAQWEQDRLLPSSWFSILTIPSYRKRAIIGFLTCFFGQTTGTLIIANYGPTIYGSLGFGVADQLYFNAG